MTAVYNEGGRMNETLEWAKVFWTNYFLRGTVIWDPDGQVGGRYRQPYTGLPFSRGFIIDPQGKVEPYFGYRPKAVIQKLYELTGYAGSDPLPPAGGFPVAEILDQPVTYADGYRTKADVRLPDPARVEPPTLGWPCLLLVHGFGGHRRGAVAGLARYYAELGYVTVTYDVRGQGDTRTLNAAGGSFLVGGVEKADMAEIFHHVKTALAELVDFHRLGVVGASQGGVHAWAAAAWSDRQLPVARGNIQYFPKIRVVAAGAASPDFAGTLAPEGNAFSARAILKFFTPTSGVDLDPAFQQLGQQFFRQQNFAGWGALRRDPGRQDAAWVKQCRVAVFAHHAYDDWWAHPNRMVDAVGAMPAATPRLVQLTTGDHGSVPNQLELSLSLALERRWLDRFMKGTTDDLPDQDRFLVAVTPDRGAVHLNPASVWALRQRPAWPGTGVTATRTLYLRQNGQLSDRAPTGAEPADRVTHQVAPGFTPAAWVATGNVAAAVFRSVPLSSVAYRSAPLGADAELHGRARAVIHLDSPAPNLQLHVALFDEAPARPARYVTGGFRCLRGRPPGAASYPVDLGDSAYVFRRGHRLVLAVENHVYHRPLGMAELRTVPYFESYTFDVQHAAGAVSKIDLPLCPGPGLSSRATTLTVSAAAGGQVPIVVDGSAVRAGHPYVTAASLSGTVPGIVVRGTRVPLNLDPLTWLSLGSANSILFRNFLGTLDTQGRATPTFAPWPGLLTPALVGSHLSFVTVTLDGSRLIASPATQVRIEP